MPSSIHINHSMRQTSLLAYFDNEFKKKMMPKEKEVYEVIKRLGKCTDREIQRTLGWEINCVCGRRNGLFKNGLIREAGTIVNELKRTVTLWEIKPTQE